MRPIRSFLVILLLFASLLGLQLLLPDYNLVPSVGKLVQPLINSADNIVDTVLYPTSVVKDSLQPVKEADTVVTISSNELLIDSLFDNKGLVRIIYYGDSQIEGDRISSYLRHQFRQHYGGTGPGLLLPVMPVMYTKSVWVQSSSNWERYNYMSFNDSIISHKRFGPFMSVCRYLPEDSISTSPVKADVLIKPSFQSDSSTMHYDRFRLLYNCNEGEVVISVKEGKTIYLIDTLSNAPGVQELSCDLNGASQVVVKFTGCTSPDVYGISIESKSGIIVDNVPLRGSTGLEFTMIDKENLKQCYDILKPDLIVLQYGLNIVRNVRNDYSYYKRGIERQIELLKQVSPGTSVLIVGVTEMADVHSDTVTLFENIPAIVKSQREAAEETGVAFWDAYQAMGGIGSVNDWAKQNLVQNDYTHFSYNGADTLAKLMFEDLFAVDFNKSTDTLDYKKPIDADTLSASISLSDGHVENITTDRSGMCFLTGIFSYDTSNPMIFTSIAFWLFFLVIILLYSLFYKRCLVRNLYLLLVSIFFYYKTGGLFVLLLLMVILLNYSSGLAISRSVSQRKKRLFLILGICANLLILAYFKYTGFFVGLVNDMLGTSFIEKDYLAMLTNNLLGSHFNIDNIILPIGISFFLFQSISYIVDVYRDDVEVVNNIVDFGFYVSFFPQLVAGPIVRASEFIPQLHTPYNASSREFSHALFLISKGLIKKIVISDFIAMNLVDRVFDMPAAFSGFENLMAVYGYALQIYCDFSGYTDIAIGLALVLGFRIPANFNSPYKAVDLSDFWRRWHISLSRWLKDYLYIPLGGNRKGSVRTYLNLLITMLLGGLWHGASMKFVIWGGMHGIGLVVNRIWRKITNSNGNSGLLGRFFTSFLTFHFVCLCWIFFRSTDTNSAFVMLSQIFNSFSPGAFSEVLSAYGRLFAVMIAGYSMHLLPEDMKESYRGMFIRSPLVIQIIAVLLIAIFISAMQSTDVMPFIYFRF